MGVQPNPDDRVSVPDRAGRYRGGERDRRAMHDPDDETDDEPDTQTSNPEPPEDDTGEDDLVYGLREGDFDEESR